MTAKIYNFEDYRKNKENKLEKIIKGETAKIIHLSQYRKYLFNQKLQKEMIEWEIDEIELELSALMREKAELVEQKKRLRGKNKWKS